jgi:hypothetical protein
MEAVYYERKEKGVIDDPYLIKLRRGSQILTFFGTRHSNEIADPQNGAIEREWQLYVNNENPSKVAFSEGGVRPLMSTREEAISKWSEPGLLRWLADRDGVQLASPEPSDAEEILYLREHGFALADIMTYYFVRQTVQYKTRDYKNYPDWR